MQLAGQPVNDNAGLEREADVMGTKARQTGGKAQLLNISAMIGNQVAQQKSIAHANECGCAACAGENHATGQMMSAQLIQRKTIQMKKRGVCGQDPCICPNNSGPVPTGNYKNTSGHHDKTKDKSAAKKVVRNYTGKRRKKPKGG